MDNRTPTVTVLGKLKAKIDSGDLITVSCTKHYRTERLTTGATHHIINHYVYLGDERLERVARDKFKRPTTGEVITIGATKPAWWPFR